MNEVVPFSFEDQEVRVVTREGEPWWVLADVCRVLGIGNPSDAARRLDDDEKMTLDNTEGHSGQRGGAQAFTIVNESGLYSLVLTSRKAEAKRFKKWVTATVLPAIRKTGGYGRPALDLRDPVQLARAATQLMGINGDLQQKVIALTTENEALTSEKGELTRKLREESVSARELAVLQREVRRATEAMGLPVSHAVPSTVADHLAAPEVLDELLVPTVGRRSLNHLVVRQLRLKALELGRTPVMDPRYARPLFHIDVVTAWREAGGEALIREHLQRGQMVLLEPARSNPGEAGRDHRREAFCRWMDANELTVHEVARRSGVSAGPIYDFMRRRGRRLSAVSEVEIAKAFGVRVAAIFGGSPP